MMIYFREKWTPDKCIFCFKPVDTTRSSNALKRFLNIGSYGYCSMECAEPVRNMQTIEEIDRVLSMVERNTGAKRL